jgi:formiminotetrahydrofolate cyclodeaminase
MQTTIILENHDLETLEKVKSILKSMQVKFTMKKTNEYNEDFVSKILESKEQVKKGMTTRIDPNDFKDFLGL